MMIRSMTWNSRSQNENYWQGVKMNENHDLSPIRSPDLSQIRKKNQKTRTASSASVQMQHTPRHGKQLPAQLQRDSHPPTLRYTQGRVPSLTKGNARNTQ